MTALSQSEPTQQTPEIEIMEVALNFRAMNTDIELLIYTDETEKAVAASHNVETIFAETEASLSRFRPTSELSRLNQQGYLEEASTLLYQNVEAALQMNLLTEGIFDPTILNALEAAGYDRSFELIGGVKAAGPHLLSTPGIIANYNNAQFLKLDPMQRSIKLPYGTHLDLGGIAKGATVDRVAEFLRQAGFTNFMISAGGDMFLQGFPPQAVMEQGWTVAVQNPMLEADTSETNEILTTLLVLNKAVATSATTGRRWLVNGQRRHHLIDPRTGEPTDNGLASVTAVADSVQMADVMAKTALILGPVEVQKRNLLQRAGLTSLIFVTLHGEMITL
jgi:thiamine biosynthesis lipoprotein